MSHRVTSAVSAAPIFATLPTAALRRLEGLMTPVQFADGDRLCIEAEIGREAFVIVSGSAIVTQADQEVAELGPGDLVGERALLTGERRSATVTAAGPVTAFVMSRREFASVLALRGVRAAVEAVADQRTQLPTPAA